MILVISTQRAVIRMAAKKLTAVCNCPPFAGIPSPEGLRRFCPVAAKILLRTARETIKTINGNRKATITLLKIDGHVAWPNRR